jgi:hypothetical protein
MTFLDILETLDGILPVGSDSLLPLPESEIKDLERLAGKRSQPTTGSFSSTPAASCSMRRSRMTPDTFVNRVLQTVVADGLDTYRGIFARPGTVSDEQWKRALDLYRSLPRRHRKVLLEIMQQVTIDTLSEVFGILDGSSALGGRSERFEAS